MIGIRNYESVADMRRVVKTITHSSNPTRATLASIKKSINRDIIRGEHVIAVQTDSDGAINVRGPRSGGSSTKPAIKLSKSSVSNIQKLTKLLEDRQEKLQVINHISELIQHHFDKEDPIVIRLARAVAALVKDCTNLFNETNTALSEMSRASMDDAFKSLVATVGSSLKERFDSKFKKFSVTYSMAVSPDAITKTSGINTKKIDNTKLYNIAYLTFDELNTGSSTSDYVVVVTRVTDANSSTNYVRTLTDYRPPNWLIKHNLGLEFTDAKKALSIVYNTMQMENMLDVVNPSGIPIKKSIVKFTNSNIAQVDVNDDEGKIVVYLKPAIKTAEAVRPIMTELFAELKRMIKTVHPRFKNPIKLSEPKQHKVVLRGRPTLLWTLTFTFSKPQADEVKTGSAEVTRNKVAEFVKLFGISDAEEIKELNRMLKKFLGAK